MNLIISVTVEATIDATITISDITGKQYYNGNFSLLKGENKLPVDMSKTHVAEGMYIVKINGNGLEKTMMLIVK